METHLAFTLNRTAIRDNIFIPKFYDPELDLANELAAATFELPELGDILLPGRKGSQLGDWIRRNHYGSGNIPYVRTSDLSHWRIRPDYKKGIAEDVFDVLRAKQDVSPGDILMVAHGTYLVGNVAMVTDDDSRLVLQDHVFRLRVNPASGVHPNLLLAALSTNFVRRQVRSRQFSADIIDKIGFRHLGIRVPLPKDSAVADSIVRQVSQILKEQTQTRADIRDVSNSDLRMTRERAESRHGFRVRVSDLKRRVLIPKYYDPSLEADLSAVQQERPWVSIGSLVNEGLLSAETGIEVGKMAYGTGPIPFLRTSDLADWEIKRDPKQGVSEGIYFANEQKAGLLAGDILLVRDGTYLVGSSALVTEDDLPALFSGGLYRLRTTNPEQLNPFTLLAFLNLPLVRRQMRARQFTRDVIDTLGRRLEEVLIPSPRSPEAETIGERVRAVMLRKAEVKRLIGATIEMLEPPLPAIAAGRPGWSMR